MGPCGVAYIRAWSTVPRSDSESSTTSSKSRISARAERDLAGPFELDELEVDPAGTVVVADEGRAETNRASLVFTTCEAAGNQLGVEMHATGGIRRSRFHLEGMC